jgi:hypothetical protein
MKKLLPVTLVLVLLVAGFAFFAYQQGWIAPPTLTLTLHASAPDGVPLSGVRVQAAGLAQGETDVEGNITFPFKKRAGEELTVRAQLDRPGFAFAPWEELVVVRKWDRAIPTTLAYKLEAALTPVAVVSSIRVDADGAPAAGADIELDGKPLGTTDQSGALSVPLGDQISKTGKIAVKLKGYKPWSEVATLRGADVLNVSLSKVGVVYGALLAAYESMGRLVPISGAEVVLAGRPVGSTDDAGMLRISTPPGEFTVEVTKEGFLPEPAVATLSGRSRDIVVPLYPRDAPAYRIAVLPAKNGKPGDSDVESALPEVEDRLSDYLFSYACFRRVDSGAFTEAMASAGLSEERILTEGWEKTPLSKLADAVVFSEVTNDNRLIVSVQVLSASGERLGAFAESDKRAKVRSICENAAKKIVEVFPFEGHVVAIDGRQVVSSLGSGQDRGLQKGNEVTFYRLSATHPTQLKSLGKGSVKSMTENSSTVVPTGDLADLAVGDKLVVLPRNREAAFNGSLALTVKAGREGFEQAFPDVNVYRDGTWVGVTSGSGELQVPVASGGKHAFLFVRSGIAPHREDVKLEGARGQQVVIMPNSISRLRVESQPSGAQVTLDGRLIGMTPLDVDVPMGFRRIKLNAGGEWRVFDKVLELTKLEEDYTGARRFALERDVLGASDALLAKGDVDGAIAVLSTVEPEHADYSAAHNRLGGIYLDSKKQPAKAVAEFERVLSRPENKELVNKRFTVTFLNLGRAYYLTGTPEGSEKAIPVLLTARDNKRFFPRERYDRASHDTLYFLALASHKLYYARPSEKLLYDTAQRWKDYFDFFPEELRNDTEVQEARAGAEHFQEELRRKLGESQ